MGQKELIAAAQSKLSTRVEPHHVQLAVRRGFVIPAGRVGMAFLYPPEAVDGLVHYVSRMRPWRRGVKR